MSSVDNFAAIRQAPFSIRVVADDEHTLRMMVQGELDLSTSPRLEATLERELSGPHDVLLDLSQLQFIDSSGLHVIMRAIWESRSRGDRLKLSSALSLQARRLFELVGLLEDLPLSNR